MQSVLSTMLGRVVRFGSLRVIFASGAERTFGDGSEDTIVLRLTDRAAERAIALDPALKLGEMFMDGRLLVERGCIFDLLSLLKRNGLRRGATILAGLRGLARLAAQRAAARLPIDNARRNAAHHYDLDARLFDLFLDEDWQYSCAYFEPPGISLGAAQLAKKRHVAAKLLVTPGQRVLDVGCGWGGLGLYLAEVCGADVTGITLSAEQSRVAQGRAERRGLEARARFELMDYRRMAGEFDRIVSVGMFEHVGARDYPAFFAQMARLLRKEGVMLLHAIGRTKPARATNPWIEKYIFPGGYMPALSEVLPAAERAGLLIKDVEILPMHYAWTLRAWRERFMARRAEAAELRGERFCRMWEFYLATAEAAFRHDRLLVFQIQFARHQDAVPYARTYVAEREALLAQAETRFPPPEPVRF
jgi:cyclopropane-fatty-acyl-phospholipid synthase